MRPKSPLSEVREEDHPDFRLKIDWRFSDTVLLRWMKRILNEKRPLPPVQRKGIASLLTPAFRIGGLLKGHVPIDLPEADQSQSGKTYRHKLIAAIYNETPKIISLRRGGVGRFAQPKSRYKLTH